MSYYYFDLRNIVILFSRSLQPISEACENKDDPSITESNNAITNDYNNTLNDDYQNIKNQSLSSEKSDVIVGSNDQPIYKDSYSPCLKVIEKFQEIVMDSAVRVIQAAFKRFRERRRFLRIKKAVMVIQRNLRKWIQARQCLRPAEFERQSSDGAKSDDYRESQEMNKEKMLERDSDDSLDEEAKVNSHVNSNTNTHESVHIQLNHDIDHSTQEIDTFESSNKSIEITKSYSDLEKLDGTNSQDLTVCPSESNTTQQDPNPDSLDFGQKDLNQKTTENCKADTVNESCTMCEGSKETIEIGMTTGSRNACGESPSIQLLNEGVSSDNAATIVLEERTCHQQEHSTVTSHDELYKDIKEHEVLI